MYEYIALDCERYYVNDKLDHLWKEWWRVSHIDIYESKHPPYRYMCHILLERKHK